ncbi:hypothetical protein HC891_08765 [Candidatus Gracilibacteria bacterium]|nr:hypothetical protein [Candidatus Gracilibacteria bacterium]
MQYHRHVGQCPRDQRPRIEREYTPLNSVLLRKGADSSRITPGDNWLEALTPRFLEDQLASVTVRTIDQQLLFGVHTNHYNPQRNLHRRARCCIEDPSRGFGVT